MYYLLLSCLRYLEWAEWVSRVGCYNGNNLSCREGSRCMTRCYEIIMGSVWDTPEVLLKLALLRQVFTVLELVFSYEQTLINL